MDFSQLQTDPTAEKQGVWIALQDAEFLIAGANSIKYRKALAKHSQQEQAGLRKNDPEALDRVTVAAMADGILLDWRGNVLLEGKSIEYSRETARRLLGIAAFREWVAMQSNNLANFQAGEEETATGALKSHDALAQPVGDPSGLA
jgi:hypothetical protein